VLLALAIFSILLAVLYGTMFVSHKAVEDNEESLLSLHELRTALDVIRREVEAAVPAADDALRFKVRDRDIFGKQASQLEFATFMSHVPGAAAVSYRVEQVEDRLVLLKKSSPAFLPPEGGGQGGREAEVFEKVSSFTVEASNGKRWLRTWDVDELPSELRVTISIPLDGRDITLSETMTPRMGARI
jgi:general secretion pathway protein J